MGMRQEPALHRLVAVLGMILTVAIVAGLEHFQIEHTYPAWVK